MKTVKMTVMFLVMLNLCLAADSKESAKIKMAKLSVKILITDTAKIYESKKLDGDLIYKEILDNVAKNLTSDKSLNSARSISKKYLEDAWKSEIEGIINQNDPDKIYFTEEERQKFFIPPASSIKDNLDKNLEAVHDPQRTKAVKEQGTLLNDKIICTLTEKDIEDKSISAQDLHIKLLEAFSKAIDQPLYEENETTFSSSRADAMIADAKSQLKEQRVIVGESGGGSSVSLEGNQANINEELKNYQLGLKSKVSNSKAPFKVYDNFKSVKDMVPIRAHELIVIKFLNGIERLSFLIDKSEIAEIINKNLQTNVSRKKSLEFIKKYFEPGILQGIIDFQGKKSEVKYQSSLKELLSELLATNSSCKAAATAVLSRSIVKNFDSARADISAKQFKDYFGPLSEKTWIPSDSEVETYRKSWSKDILSPLQKEGVSSLIFDEFKMLDETKQLVEVAVKKSLIEGSKAYSTQDNLVESEASNLRIEVKDVVKFPRYNLTVKTIEENLSARVKSSWAKSSLSAKYDHLFPSIVSGIAKTARTIVDVEVKRREDIDKARQAAKDKAAADAKAAAKADADAKAAAKAKAAADAKAAKDKAAQESKGPNAGEGSEGDSTGPGGGTTTDNGSGGGQSGSGNQGAGGPEEGRDKPEKKGSYKPDLIIDLDVQGNSISVNMRFFKDSRGRGTDMSYKFNITSSDPEVILSQMGDVRFLFEKWFSGNVQGDEEVSLFIAARILDGKVSYGAVISLRRCIEGAVNKLKKENLKIYWYDDYYKKELWRDREYIPETFKKKFRMIA